MSCIALVLACSACAGHRRYAKPCARPLRGTVSETGRSPPEKADILNALAKLLFSVSQRVAFNPSGAGALNPTRTAANPPLVRMATKSAKRKGKSKSSSNSKFSYGFGKAAAAPARPAAADILKDAMDVFEELRWIAEEKPVHSSGHSDEQLAQALKKILVTEWVITLRTNSSFHFRDWVPISFLNIGCSRYVDPRKIVPAAIGASSKPILIAASRLFPEIKNLNQKTLEFAFEPVNDFFEHVIEIGPVQEEKVKACMATLKVNSTDRDEVESAYHKMKARLHEKGAVKAQFDYLEGAYRLLSRSSSSFYESLGGSKRHEFSGALTSEALGPLGKLRPEQEMPLDGDGWQAGVSPLDSDTAEASQVFYDRNAYG